MYEAASMLGTCIRMCNNDGLSDLTADDQETECLNPIINLKDGNAASEAISKNVLQA